MKKAKGVKHFLKFSNFINSFYKLQVILYFFWDFVHLNALIKIMPDIKYEGNYL